MVAMPVTLQTGENEGRCPETYIKHTEISHVLCNMYMYENMYVIYK